MNIFGNIFLILLIFLFLGTSIIQIIKMYKLYTGRSLKFKWFKSKKEKWDKDGSNQPTPIPGGEHIPLFDSNSEYLRFNYKKQPTIPEVKL